jgi:hypothetical protein
MGGLFEREEPWLAFVSWDHTTDPSRPLWSNCPRCFAALTRGYLSVNVKMNLVHMINVIFFLFTVHIQPLCCYGRITIPGLPVAHC